jgi:regulatory protein YycI of two-component signal transduction system YycFG
MISFKDKILIISNFIFFIALIISLISRSIFFIVFAILINLLLLYVYFYYNKEQDKIKEELDNNNQAIINNKLCVKPSKNNPFMNPTIVDINNNPNKDLNACSIDNRRIKRDINNHFLNNQYRDVIDIYDRNSSQRQFYTMPSTTIPNNQEAFSKWLYYRKESCKEGNGEQCFNNIM